jgi:hypothetical protein
MISTNKDEFEIDEILNKLLAAKSYLFAKIDSNRPRQLIF